MVALIVKQRDVGEMLVGNCDLAPAAMEGGAIRDLARIEAARPGGSRIGVLVTDGQNSVQTICSREGWHPEHVLDPGHLVRCVDRRITAHLGYVPPGQKNRRLCLAEPRSRLLAWFRTCGKRPVPLEQKQADWDGALAHYTAPTSTWKYKDDPAARDLLARFLADARPMLARYQVELNTQACEAYNALRSKLEDKNTSWKITHEPRSFATALIFNFGYEWLVEFCEETTIEHDPELFEWILGESGAIMTRRAQQRTLEYRAAKNCRRIERKAGQSAKKRATDVVHVDETQIEEDPLESRDRVGNIRPMANRPAAARLYGEGVCVMPGITFDNTPARFCHLNAPLELLIAMPELTCPIVREDDASRDDAARDDAFAELIAQALEADWAHIVDTEWFRDFLVNASSLFQAGGATADGEIEGDWFSAWQAPGETFGRLIDVFRGVAFDLGGGRRSTLGELFAMQVSRRYLPAAGRDGCAAEFPVDSWIWAMLAATGGDVPLTNAENGDWLLPIVTHGMTTVTRMCSVCRREHEFACVGEIDGLGEYFAIDYNCCVRVPGPGPAKFVPVHVPLDIDVPLTEGRRVRYTMFGFVQLKESHAVAYLRISPTHFAVYDDNRGISWAVIPTSAVQIRAHVSLAIYRSTV